MKGLTHPVTVEPSAQAGSDAHEGAAERTDYAVPPGNPARRMIASLRQPVRLLVREQRQILLEVLEMLRPDRAQRPDLRAAIPSSCQIASASRAQVIACCGRLEAPVVILERFEGQRFLKCDFRSAR